MSKAYLLIPAIAIALLCICVESSTAAVMVTPDAIVGKWHGTSPANTCPMTELNITQKFFTFTQEGAPHTLTVHGISMNGKATDEINLMTTHEDIYHFHDKNHMELYGTFAQCQYTRE